MESSALTNEGEDHIDLPPGFRFHPNDEELISHYLSKKVLDSNFTASAIGDVDLNKCEPWDLPWKAKMGEKEWYFFCVRDRKYPTGLRTNRATEAGYWKATGKDKEIYRGKTLVGMKKTLVFYKGRAPKGEKTNWVMHEYRLEGKFSLYNLPKTAKNEWVISRIFQKSSSGKKIHAPGMVRMCSFGDEFGSSRLPPLTDSPHVTCFSNVMEGSKNQEEMIDCFKSPPFSTLPTSSSDISSPSSMILSKLSHLPSSLYNSQGSSMQYSNYVLMQESVILRALLENQGPYMKHSTKIEREMNCASQETCLTTDMNTEISSVVSNHEMGRRHFEDQEDPSASAGPLDLDCLWNY